VGRACGYSGGFTNAFTVGVAQGIAGLPLFSGMWLRIAAFVAFLSVSIVYVTMHAIKVRKNPESSPVYEEDKTHVVNIDVYNVPKLTIRHKLVLLILVGSVVALIVGVTQFGFYIDELSAVFLIAGVLAGIVGGLKPGEMTDEFIKGCGNLLWAGMAIGLCGAATYILQSTNIIDTVIQRLRYVRCPEYFKHPDTLRLRSGGGYDADYGPAFRCAGSDKADGGSGISVRRFIYKRSHPYLCNSDGRFINGQGPLGEMDQVPGSALRSVGSDNLCVPNFCGKGWIRTVLVSSRA